MELGEFIKKVKKTSGKRNHKITNSYGVKEAFTYYRQIRPKEHKYVLTDLEFMKIIRHINNLLKEDLIAGNDIILPERMGRLNLRKRRNRVDFKDGKLKVTMPVDWDATLKLWYEDPESFKNKQLVRFESLETFSVKYDKSKANYNNKTFYHFHLNRDIKVQLKKNIKNNKIDAFVYGTEY